MPTAQSVGTSGRRTGMARVVDGNVLAIRYKCASVARIGLLSRSGVAGSGHYRIDGRRRSSKKLSLPSAVDSHTAAFYNLSVRLHANCGLGSIAREGLGIMRIASFLFATLCVVLGAVPVLAEGNGCNGGPAPIVLKNATGTLVVCGVLDTIDPKNRLNSRVSFASYGDDAEALSARLTEMTGTPIHINPIDGASTPNIDVADVPLAQVLLKLAEHGQVTVHDLDFQVLASLRAGLLDAGGVQVELHEARLGDVLATLQSVVGREIVTDSTALDTRVTLAFESASLRDVLKRLAVETHLKITLKKPVDSEPIESR